MLNTVYFESFQNRRYNRFKGDILMRLVVLLVMLPFLIPIILAVLFIIKLILKGKAEGWKGTVLDKNHNSKRDFDDHNKIEHFYSLKVKMTDGKIRNIAVNSQFYEECTAGDVIEKPKGALFPKKVSETT